jgi:hypothetical protein
MIPRRQIPVIEDESPMVHARDKGVRRRGRGLERLVKKKIILFQVIEPCCLGDFEMLPFGN